MRKKEKHTPFCVINQDFNRKEFKPYDIMPYLMECYKATKTKDRPKIFAEFSEFVERKCLYMYWSRSQYELILAPLIGDRDKEATKIDVYWQIMMNFDLVVRLLMENVGIKDI